jgi:hypothetical protein
MNVDKIKCTLCDKEFLYYKTMWRHKKLKHDNCSGINLQLNNNCRGFVYYNDDKHVKLLPFFMTLDQRLETA